jgi:drug/metabolite transporter (DMT)-like permease
VALYIINKLIPNKAIQYVLLSVIAFSIMQTLVKYLTAYSPFQHIFIRSVIGWFVCYYFLKKRGISLKGKNQKFLIIRGLIGGINMFGFFFILTRIPFATSIALKYLSPIFATIFSVILLKVKVKPILWLCFITSVIGVIMIKGVDDRISTLDLIIGVGSSVFGGLLYIVIRKIGDDDNHLVILHYYMIITGIFSLLFAVNTWVSPSLNDGLIFLISWVYSSKLFHKIHSTCR